MLVSTPNHYRNAYFAIACAAGLLLAEGSSKSARAAVLGGVDLGGLTDNLFVFTDGSSDLNWQSSSKGYVGDVAVDGITADQRTSGTIAYAGNVTTNDSTLGAWQGIVDDNPTQATATYGDTALISGLESDLASAFTQINALSVTGEITDFNNWSGNNSQNGICETFVYDVTGGFQVSNQITITGDACDAYIFRWDEDKNAADGYEGTVKFQSGGAIVPTGDLTAGNFIHAAGDINASGGGSTPASPYPQGPRLDDGTGDLIDGGSDFSGGGFFTGYWLTTGDPTSSFETSSLSNAVFVGGWYSSSTKISMTSGTSGVYVQPVPEPSGLILLGIAGSLVCLRRRRR